MILTNNKELLSIFILIIHKFRIQRLVYKFIFFLLSFFLSKFFFLHFKSFFLLNKFVHSRFFSHGINFLICFAYVTYNNTNISQHIK